ncbi:MAG: SpoVR family protein [Myxococcota bacterium]|jgi:stage V sporulation protein R|nr:SpoVR family protein [Myxococcota bacterium]
MSLPAHLDAIHQKIRVYAEEFGLDTYQTVFECISYDQMNMIASYGGFPTRYPHWKFGMEYEQLSKHQEYGLSKIYELVINNDPCYAYLLAANPDVDQKLVMAHVYGHNDFFKNNFSFAHTDRKMMDTTANHATKIRRYIDRYGIDRVESFIDKALSIENLIDRQLPYIKRRDLEKATTERDAPMGEVPVLPTDREYMRPYINPDEFVEAQKKKMEEERDKERKFPEHPERDVMLFMMEHAPLENWERDILGMLREEAYYFLPQGQTKIMNEGWASYWHTTIMTQRAMDDSEVLDYADRHAGTMGVQPGRINPYKLGLELFRDIEERWNKGQFGKEWEDCDDLQGRRAWDTQAGLGREKIFDVRRHYNDVTFIDAFLTPEFAHEQKMFNYDFNKKSGSWEIMTREFQAIKAKLLESLTNFGQPFVQIVDGNFENKGELLIRHIDEGVDLRDDYMRDTMRHIFGLWSRPIVLATCREKREILIKFDGAEFSEKEGTIDT